MSDKVVKPVDWKTADHLPHAQTGKHTQIQVKKASVPLVLVPGIMGSRLERSNGSFVWDPNSKGGMMANYLYRGGATRKKTLIDNPNPQGTRRVMAVRNGSDPSSFKNTLLAAWVKKPWIGATEVHLPQWTWLPDPIAKLQGEARANAMASLAAEQGWMEVAWGFYGKFLLELAETRFQQFKWIFHHPVYAVGYDWVDDNRNAGQSLTERIEKIMQKEVSYGRDCKKVIVISHSMGGLVTRASVVPGIAKSCSKANVLGVVHGAQPASGAPAAYRRMRAGFESTPTQGAVAATEGYFLQHIMGVNSSQVVPVLGGCIGGLELLPTQNYRRRHNGKEYPNWLFQIEQDGTLGEGLPKRGDPYGEIYTEDKDFLRLVYDPQLLDPDAKPVVKKTGHSDPGQQDQSAYALNIGAAKKFHHDLDNKAHGATFIAWGENAGLATFNDIEYRFRSIIAPGDVGSGSDLDPSPPDGSQPSYFTVSGPHGIGDQTVPEESGSFLLPKSLNHGLVGPDHKAVSGQMKNSHEHGDFFNDPEVQKFVYAAVQELSFQYREDTIGK